MKPLLLDPGEEEIMLPIPSAAQDLLWDEIYTLVKEEDLNREVKWLETPWEIRKYLASIESAKKIDDIGLKFDLGYQQINALAKNIKYVFIQEVALKDFVSTIIKDLRIENKMADRISQEIKSDIFVPMREYLLKIYPPQPIKSEIRISKSETPKESKFSAGQASSSNQDSKLVSNSILIQKKKDNGDIKPDFTMPVIANPAKRDVTISLSEISSPPRPGAILHNDKVIINDKMSKDDSNLGIAGIAKYKSSSLAFKKPKLMVPLAVEKKVVIEEIKPEKFKAVSDAHVQGIALDHFYEKIKMINNHPDSQAVNKEKEAPIVWQSVSAPLGKEIKKAINQESNRTIKQEASQTKEDKNIKPPVQNPVPKSINLKEKMINEKEQDKKISEQLSKMPIRTMQGDIKE